MPTPRVLVIIPAFNEELSIGRVLADIPRDLVTEVVVADNASTDGTAAAAAAGGATVLHEPRRGYGSACLRGIEYASALPAGQRPDIIVFLDGDYSDFPGEMHSLVEPISKREYDMIIGSRMLGEREPGALLPQAVFGNALATFLLRLLYGARFTDLGPFRAIRLDSLLSLGMRDRTFGWTVEMQVRAVRMGLRSGEVPVSYRRRIGTSKVTGTLYGTIMAGYKILWTIFKLWAFGVGRARGRR